MLKTGVPAQANRISAGGWARGDGRREEIIVPDIRDRDTQKAIADAYIANGGNKERAVIAAGYSERYARGNAHRLVADSGVQAMIAERNAVISDNRIADMAEINAFWTAVMRDRETKMPERLKASEMRAKALGAFLDRVEGNMDSRVTLSLSEELKDFAQ